MAAGEWWLGDMIALQAWRAGVGGCASVPRQLCHSPRDVPLAREHH